jgi:hypothetical protein
MNTVIEKQFNAIGARVKISEPSNRFRTPPPFSIDVRRDEEGEFFDIKVKKEIELLTLDVQKNDRHLLLLTRDPDNPKAKFLCGHDERHWFTCAIPERAPVSTVVQAKQALKPVELREIESREGLKTKNAHKRHRKLASGRKIHRQGEFMFIPEPNYEPSIVLKNEPMTGGGHNMHYAQFLSRFGGQAVYVNTRFAPNGILESEYRKMIKDSKEAKKSFWRRMQRDPVVHVKGKITHIEHSTVDLGNAWHKVVLNTEAQAKARKFVAFLD